MYKSQKWYGEKIVAYMYIFPLFVDKKLWKEAYRTAEYCEIMEDHKVRTLSRNPTR